MNTSRLASKRLASHLQSPRSSSSRSEAILDFLSGQPPESPEILRLIVAVGDLHPRTLLERFAMLSERQVGVVFELSRQPLPQHRPFCGRRTWYGKGLHVPALPAPLELTLDR